MLKLKKGDKIRVLSGKDKGREGTIEILYAKSGKAIVPGINMYKKHVKKTVAKDGKGGIYDIPRPIHLSKLALIDPKTGKNTRVKFSLESGKKIRVAVNSGTKIDTTKPKKTKN